MDSEISKSSSVLLIIAQNYATLFRNNEKKEILWKFSNRETTCDKKRIGKNSVLNGADLRATYANEATEIKPYV